MGCGCKANQQITFLEKKYGENTPQSKKTNISGMVAVGAKKALTVVAIIPILPIAGLFIICKHIFTKNKPIDINKTFKIAG